MQPPQAVVSVFSAMVGQSRAAIDPSVQQIFRSAALLCLHCNLPCSSHAKLTCRMLLLLIQGVRRVCLFSAAIISRGLG